MSNTRSVPGRVGGETHDYGGQWTPAHQFLQWPPRPAQVNTNNGYTARQNILQDYANVEATGNMDATNSSSAGISNSTFPSNVRYQHPGGFDNLPSIHSELLYPMTYGTTAPRMIRGPPLSIATDHIYYPNRGPGFPQPQAPPLSGSSNTSSLAYYPPPDSGQTSEQDNYLQVLSPRSSPTPPVLRRSTSPFRTVSVRTRRSSQRPQHCQYTDPLLRSKYPEGRHYALNLAIQFRDDHDPTTLIPNDLIDELLQESDDGKYYCFCCPNARKSRTITPARDHVRKSLGNFPFRCPNPWCQHSSLRQADLTKHMRSCTERLYMSST